jgi:hypothetical protein
MIDVDFLQAKRAEYVKGRQDLLAQAERQLAIQDGAIAAIDDLLKMVEMDEGAPLAEMDMADLEGAEVVAAR